MIKQHYTELRFKIFICKVLKCIIWTDALSICELYKASHSFIVYWKKLTVQTLSPLFFIYLIILPLICHFVESFRFDQPLHSFISHFSQISSKGISRYTFLFINISQLNFTLISKDIILSISINEFSDNRSHRQCGKKNNRNT